MEEANCPNSFVLFKFIDYSFHSKPSSVQSLSISCLLLEIDDVSDQMIGVSDGLLSPFPYQQLLRLNCGLDYQLGYIQELELKPSRLDCFPN